MAYLCTDHELWNEGPISEPQRTATLEWLRFHDIDPMRIPQDNCIMRDEVGCKVQYTEFVFDENGTVLVLDLEPVTRTAYSQGEAPPLPWPAELTSTEPSAEGAME